LADGRSACAGSKHRTAAEKKVRIFSEQQFWDLPAQMPAAHQPQPQPATAATLGAATPRPGATPRAATSSSLSPSLSGSRSAEVSRKLTDWLRRWPEMHSHGDKSKKAAKAGKDNPGAKVCVGALYLSQSKRSVPPAAKQLISFCSVQFLICFYQCLIHFFFIICFCF